MLRELIDEDGHLRAQDGDLLALLLRLAQGRMPSAASANSRNAAEQRSSVPVNADPSTTLHPHEQRGCTVSTTANSHGHGNTG